MPDCSICCESFTRTRKAVACPYCATEFCRECLHTSLLNMGEPACFVPTCKTPWNDEFLTTACHKAWLRKEYKQHRENLLLDLERARLPEAQEDAIRYQEALQAVNEANRKIKDIERRNANLPEYQVYVALKARNAPLTEVWRAEDAYKKARAEIISEMDAIWSPEYRTNKFIVSRTGKLYVPDADAGGAGAESKPAEKPREGYVFMMRCPADACEGFVGKSWSCGLCKMKVCKECREPSGAGHACDEAKVLNVKALVQEAKPCPKCASMISKVDGCDQMWCTQCHVAFSWRTGQKETLVHNPHFYEWMRRNGRAMASGAVDVGAAGGAGGAGGCGNAFDRMPPHELFGHVARIYGQMYGLPQKHAMVTVRMNLHNHARKLIELHASVVGPITQRATNEIPASEERRRVLRVRRLLKEITDEEWKVALQREEKARKKTRLLADIYGMYMMASAEILRPLLPIPPTMAEWPALRQQIIELQTYTNEQLGAAKTLFGSKVELVPIVIT